jgi:hypothetical protein
MVQNRHTLDYVTLLLKPIKASFKPMLRIAVTCLEDGEMAGAEPLGAPFHSPRFTLGLSTHHLLS